MTIHILTSSGFKKVTDCNKIINYLVSEINTCESPRYKNRLEKLLFQALSEKFRKSVDK